MKLTPVDLNNLPMFSPHALALLRSTEDSPRQVRSAEDVMREYNQDKWGRLLAEIKAHDQVSLEATEEAFFGSGTSLGCIRGSLLHANELELHRLYMAEVLSIILEMCSNNDVVEIGSGYGAFALRLARTTNPDQRPRSIVALEWTRAGREIIELLRPTDYSLRTGFVDFNTSHVSSEKIPRGAVFLTGMAIPHLLHGNIDNFLRWIISHDPSLVIHVEPILVPEDHTTLGLLRARYMEHCQYSGSLILLATLEGLAAHGVISIEERCYEVAGSNALLPASVIVWKATDNQ